ncbi:MAG: hypothetical protein HWD61_11440 [Parachlamydiaceae bacterium]|nr:MAG: hypothetical protein HWD61_11440 [Parachlamydiaceae bacterium]
MHPVKDLEKNSTSDSNAISSRLYQNIVSTCTSRGRKYSVYVQCAPEGHLLRAAAIFATILILTPEIWFSQGFIAAVPISIGDIVP